MEKPYKTDMGCLISDGIEPFLDVFMEKPYKTDMGCLISDIWVSSFF